MQNGYTQDEVAMMKRDARLKEEYENGIRELAAREEGKVEGSKETLDNNIKTMKSKGATEEMIANLLDLDIKYVNEVLNSK